jgi:hypothetical protein
MFKSIIYKIIFAILVLLLTGFVLIEVFLIPQFPKSDQSRLIYDTSKNGDLASRVDKVVQKTLANYATTAIVYVVEDQTDTPGQTEKTSSDNDFKITLQSAYFVKNNSYDTVFLKKVLIHELMHVISLQNSQVAIANPTTFDPSDHQAFDNAELRCIPDYFNTQGCFKSDSYLSAFYKQFWTGELRQEYDNIQTITDKVGFSRELSQWGDRYQTSFVSQNAFVNPEEDLAESFSFWALDFDTTNLSQTQKDKIRFFDTYPELKSVKEAYLSSFDSNFQTM